MNLQWLLLNTGLVSLSVQAYVHNSNSEIRLFVERPDNATVIALESRNQLVTPFIVDGSVAEPDTYNFHARLVIFPYPPFFQDICGASIINSHFILTAAHCVQDYKTGAALLDLNIGQKLLSR